MNPRGSSRQVDDELAEVVAYHKGDMQAAIGTLLQDIRHLRRQLALTEGAMGRGMARGWRPSYDRD
ncbi:hypothetical protein BAE36_24850 [Rhizobium leguminosarum bv. trifolii]|uniref:Dehydrogenase n=1 Tax=Rhizobium leguminosarum bv. trifolii TaxID=386 RepID=A0A1B8R6M8_RHILT|nr:MULTISPECIES: hypothetical protein [Rhizobium]AOO92615.1 dehydrogenase [Rhizobium leguminosarum bv. trifolii]OBY04444.1 hypothetical protein BAE36_24850 [Rhizobium leguminosarum bv. trifolii]TBB28106.1 hypothetical protein ELH48_13545 [Rhizobium ruizarguesonis]TBB49723.1 hypothetical protein ELH46_13540 [Rhizobium ruizarguesonis]TBE54492.1 hypothetical protein ELH04_08755 [Rhizobium leguminosarum]